MSKLILFVMGWSTYDIEWPETIPGSNGWEYRTYNNFTDAEYEFSKWKFGSAWKTQKFKAMFLGQLDIDWETGQAQFHMEERMAWPAAKVVIYNKQDVVAKPAPESNINKLLKAKLGSSQGTWFTAGGGAQPSPYPPAPMNYANIMDNFMPTEPAYHEDEPIHYEDVQDDDH